MTARLSDLDVFRVDIVDRAAVRDPQDPSQPARFLLWKSETGKAEWSTAYMNDLPDSSFAYIEPGGKKDEDGKTTPRSLRHYPFKDKDGSVDLPHLRNALSRAAAAVNAGGESAAIAQKALPKLQAAADKAGVGEQNKGDSMPENPISKKLALALSKAAENETALDAFLAKDEVSPELAAAMKGAFRLLSGAAATPEAFDAMVKAAFPGAAKPFGSDDDEKDAKAKDGAGMSGEMDFGNDKDGKPLKPHAFVPKEDADGTCAMDGFGGNHAVHQVDDAGASGSKEVEASAKAEDEPVTEETIKAELAKSDLAEPVRKMLEKAMETVKAEREGREKAEREAIEKAEQIAKSEVREIVKSEMGSVPGMAEDALVELLHGLRKSDVKAFDALRPVLKSASEAVAKSDLLKEGGSSHSNGSSDPVATINEIAKGIAKAEGMNLAKAKNEAWKRNPELHRQYQAEQSARAANS